MFARSRKQYATETDAQRSADWLNEHGAEPHRSRWVWYPVHMPLGHWELYRVQRGQRNGQPPAARPSPERTSAVVHARQRVGPAPTSHRGTNA